MSCGFSVAFLDAVFELGFLFVFPVHCVCVRAFVCVCEHLLSKTATTQILPVYKGSCAEL